MNFHVSGNLPVATILSVAGIAAGNSTYVQAKTFTSYVQFIKKGEARCSDVSSYTAFVFSGKRNHYKHVLGGKKNRSGKWVMNIHNYLDAPAYVQSGRYYNQSDSWFKEQAKQRLLSGGRLDDMPW